MPNGSHMPPHTYPPFWQQAIQELSTSDPIMGNIIQEFPGEAMEGKDDAFHTLMRSITGQQISVKAADAIWGRLESSCHGKVSVESVATLPEEALRAIGYSRQKVSYIQSLNEFFQHRQHMERDWAEMDDESVITDITQIRGIGRWTTEMFLIFHLQRPDILPLDDIGLIKAIWKYYNAGEKMDKKAMRELAKQWQPWRSVATWYLWRTYDIEPVSY